MFIYRITNTVNGKCYIGYDGRSSPGQSIRWNEHLRDYRHKKGNHKKVLYRAMDKYGVENFTYNVIEYCCSIDELKEREKYWIAHYRSTILECGYNATIGGDGTHPGLLPPETRQRMREAKSAVARRNNERRWSNTDPEYRRKHSETVAMAIDEEERQRRSERAKKQWLDPEMAARKRQAMSEAAKSDTKIAASLKNLKNVKNNKTYRITNPDGQVFITDDMPSFCKDNGLTASAMVCLRAVARGAYPTDTYKGWKCEVI